MLKRRLKIIALILFSWLLIHEIIIISDGLNDEPVTSDMAVIFGTTIYPDGSPSRRLKERLDKGIELYEKGVVSKLYVSGGIGVEGFKEGDKMAEYLIAHKVPSTSIVIDNAGNNTMMTALNFKKDASNATSVAVVTQYYHITRSKLAFKKIGITDVAGAHCGRLEIRDFWSLLREFFGYYKYLIAY